MSDLKQAPWNPDLGSDYKNPILFSDYSDPEVLRVGDCFYLTSSSFSDCPGLPILKSTDLVNWRLVGHALTKLTWNDFTFPRHGRGVWAPSLRKHGEYFYIFFPDPDDGIFMVRTKNIEGPWEPPVCVIKAKGWIDPCPYWDEQGNAWLVTAFAGSRAVIKSVLLLSRMKTDGSALIDQAGNILKDLPGEKVLLSEPGSGAWAGRERAVFADKLGNRYAGEIIYDGRLTDPTIEGPKLYQRGDYFYLFAPAGGVPNGWQLVLRSKNIAGPYERRVVLRQGLTDLNGPHQGAWVETEAGDSWFLHFMDREAYGRTVCLEPMKWLDDGWCEIGESVDQEGNGEPVSRHAKPNLPLSEKPLDQGDDFSSGKLSLEWQWPTSPKLEPKGNLYLFEKKNHLTLLPQPENASGKNLYGSPSLLLQKFGSPEFAVETTITSRQTQKPFRAGLVVNGLSYAFLTLNFEKGNYFLAQGTCLNEHLGLGKIQYGQETIHKIVELTAPSVTLKIQVEHRIRQAVVTFYYQNEAGQYTLIGEAFVAKPGLWIGAKWGVFAGGEPLDIRVDVSPVIVTRF